MLLHGNSKQDQANTANTSFASLRLQLEGMNLILVLFFHPEVNVRSARK